MFNHLSYKAQLALLIVNKASIAILSEYFDYTDMFSPEFNTKLVKYTGINDYPIDLVKGQQLLYKPIYSLKLVKLEILKIYIEINLANGFIQPFKSSIGTLIFFIQKPNSSFWLCVYYQF